VAKIFLRHARTGHYYVGNDTWTMGISDAVDFGNIVLALKEVAARKLLGMSVVIRQDDTGQEQEFYLGEGARA
jgi:hypothetical protein